MRDDEIARAALAREQAHRPGHRNYRPHVTPGEVCGGNLKGLRGEEAFCTEFNLPLDLSVRPEGDGHRDQCLWLRCDDDVVRQFVVDVKAAKIPKDLIAEIGTVKPTTVYILARYDEENDRAHLLGWQWGVELLKSVPRDYGYGIVSHWVSRHKLRPIAELHKRNEQWKIEQESLAESFS